MEPDGPPTDANVVAALVRSVVYDIDHRSDEEHELLLADLLCAAWPSPLGQDQ